LNEAEMNLRIRQWVSVLPTVRAIHFPDSRRVTSRGWVDWVFLGENGSLFVELKGSDDFLSPDQRSVRRLCVINDLGWRLWRPGDMRYEGTASRELKRIA
jgi:hypothetical protein